MASIMRSFIRAPRVRLLPSVNTQPRRFNGGSYGNEQSGQEQGTHEKNPMQHLEHPGPESPADQAKRGSDQPASQSQSSSSASSSGGSKPTIQTPKSTAEESDPEVKKHNEEMTQRADRSVNQLGEEDNKVNKKFWKGDVGNIKGES